MTPPEVLVSRAHEKFDPARTLIDQPTRRFLATFFEAFSVWVTRLTTL